MVNDLNAQQKKAVEITGGPVMIIAGPGTGKTKTLTARIAYLIAEKNINPQNILALTFTKKAAAEMQERLNKVLRNNTAPLVTTFHALGYELLNNHILTLEKNKRNLISQKTQTELVQILAENFDFLKKIPTRELLLQISRHKSQLQTDSTKYNEFVQMYNSRLQEQNLLDYDDLLLQTVNLLSDNQNVRKQLQLKYHYILVDEFQDTNNLQYQLIKLLLNKNNNLFVIGDPFQSIYAFRGANSAIFQQMKNDFPDCQEIILDINYRSHKNITTVSSRLFSKPPSLQSHSQKPGKVGIIETMHEYSEADWIINTISNKIGGTDLLQSAKNTSEDNTHVKFSDFAVIYRTHGFNQVLEQRFNDSGIPYQIVGGNSLYEQPEITFIVDCLNYLAKPTDELVKPIVESKISKISKPVLKKIAALSAVDKKIKISTIVEQIVEIFQLYKLYENKHSKLRNIHQFINLLVQFDDSADGLQKSLDYFNYLDKHEFYDPSCDKVTLLTMHAAKGLEFPYVFICGFEENSIPFFKNEDQEEEKRLLYVAMTRAKENLYLLYTKERHKKVSLISSFKELIISPECEEQIDEAIVKIQKKRKQWQEKKSQMELF